MRFHQLFFPIGYDPGGPANTIGIVRRYGFEGNVGSIFGVVQNQGAAAFTFAMHTSTDNAVANPYAAHNILVAGSGVASVLVAAGGFVEFFVPWHLDFQTHFFLKFLATPASGQAFGMLGLTHYVGQLDMRHNINTP